MREVLTNAAAAGEHVRDRGAIVGRAGDVVEVAVDLPRQRLGRGADGPAGRKAVTRVVLDRLSQRYVVRAHSESTRIEVGVVHGRRVVAQALADTLPRLAVLEGTGVARQHLDPHLGADGQPIV